jgi:EpsI family protein
VLPDSRIRPWIPALVLLLGCLALAAVNRQVVMPLVRPLEQALPDSLLGMGSVDQAINPEELEISGVSEYAFRIFGAEQDSVRLSVYVGYYEAQSQGKTIHSPKNCLPGAGWEPLEQESITIDAQGYRFPVNRYVLENKGTRALVYYWYQGRGRVSANEYLVKWEQIRDRALKGRSDEALVRIVIPVSPKLPLASADSIAVEVSKRIVRPIYSSLPAFPSRTVPAPQTGS